jgi:4-hydroxybenzoate polyprenyltransferase
MLLLLGTAGWLAGVHPFFYLVLAWAAGLMAGQVRRLREGASPALAFALFRQHVWIGAAILGGLWGGMLLN